MSNAPNIIIYGSETCAYCTAARMLLKTKGVVWEEVLISRDADKHAEMIARSGRQSVPQIFIDERPIGGFDELYALEMDGELDRLLGVQD